MVSANVKNILKGISGEYELARVLGFLGVFVYIVSVPVYVLWDVIQNGKFDVIAFCAAYPAGLGVALTSASASIAIKDRNVAVAIQKRDETSAPVPPPPLTKE